MQGNKYIGDVRHECRSYRRWLKYLSGGLPRAQLVALTLARNQVRLLDERL